MAYGESLKVVTNLFLYPQRIYIPSVWRSVVRPRFLLAILLASTAAMAFTLEELIKPRNIPFTCAEGKCSLAEDDMRFLMEQHDLLGRINLRLYERLQQCQGQRGV